MKHTRDSIVAIICECRKNGTGIVLRGADLRGADLLWTDLRYADLRGADLRWTDLRWTDLQDANLRWANLQCADLREANLDFAGYELSCKTIGIKADKRLVSQLLYHLCRKDVQDCPEWDELRNDERVIALANQSHVVDVYGLPEIEPQAQEEK